MSSPRPAVLRDRAVPEIANRPSEQGSSAVRRHGHVADELRPLVVLIPRLLDGKVKIPAPALTTDVLELDRELARTGWERIGRIDAVGRRSLWMREVDGGLELRAGREGQDAELRMPPSRSGRLYDADYLGRMATRATRLGTCACSHCRIFRRPL